MRAEATVPFFTFSYRLNLDSHSEYANSYHTVRENTSIFFACFYMRLFLAKFMLKSRSADLSVGML